MSFCQPVSLAREIRFRPDYSEFRGTSNLHVTHRVSTIVASKRILQMRNTIECESIMVRHGCAINLHSVY